MFWKNDQRISMYIYILSWLLPSHSSSVRFGFTSSQRLQGIYRLKPLRASAQHGTLGAVVPFLEGLKIRLRVPNWELHKCVCIEYCIYIYTCIICVCVSISVCTVGLNISVYQCVYVCSMPRHMYVCILYINYMFSLLYIFMFFGVCIKTWNVIICRGRWW